jgi:hypothetical protein
MINWFKLTYLAHRYSPIIRNKKVDKDYLTAYSLLKIENKIVFVTFLNSPDCVDFQVVFFTHNINKEIQEYSITLSVSATSGKLYLVYATDNHLLYNIINKSMCKHLIYYMYLETDKARQLIDNVLEEYKDE